MEYKKDKGRRWERFLSTPFIWGMLIPFVFLDLCLEVYHRVCFRLYRLPLVQRSAYIKFDRHRLTYLTIFDRVNCTYCGYANGLLRYASAIAGQSERYWCSIKHQSSKGFISPTHQKEFLGYGDEGAFRKEYGK